MAFQKEGFRVLRHKVAAALGSSSVEPWVEEVAEVVPVDALELVPLEIVAGRSLAPRGPGAPGRW